MRGAASVAESSWPVVPVVALLLAASEPQTIRGPVEEAGHYPALA